MKMKCLGTITLSLVVGLVYIKAVKACTAESENRYTKSKARYVPVSFEYVQKASNGNDILIIDVREPCEVRHGKIPNSINIPIGRFAEDLDDAMSDEEFQKLYQRAKPAKDEEFIIYCKLGKRSTIAANQAVELGYTNVKNYIGSWKEWQIRNALI